MIVVDCGGVRIVPILGDSADAAEKRAEVRRIQLPEGGDIDGDAVPALGDTVDDLDGDCAVFPIPSYIMILSLEL